VVSPSSSPSFASQSQSSSVTTSLSQSLSSSTTYSPSSSQTLSGTSSYSQTLSGTSTYSQTLSGTSSYSRSRSIFCGNGIVDAGEQCDPGPKVKKWWFVCCAFNCMFREAKRVCENRADSVCRVPRKCDGKGNCLSSSAFKKKGFKCENHTTQAKGVCNGKGKCSV